MRRKEKVYDGLKDGYKHEKDGEFDEKKKKEGRAGERGRGRIEMEFRRGLDINRISNKIKTKGESN